MNWNNMLRGLKIIRQNQVWATDITYIAVESGRAFVIDVIDLYSRKVMSYCVVNTMDTEYCIEVLNTVLRKHGNPDIFNSDQGASLLVKLLRMSSKAQYQDKYGWQRTLSG